MGFETLLAGQLRQGTGYLLGTPDERAYHDVLLETLRKVGASDRRQGLANIFWLAHSREVATQLDKHFTGPAAAEPEASWDRFVFADPGKGGGA